MKHIIFIIALIFSCGIIFAQAVKLGFVAAFCAAIVGVSFCCIFFRTKKLFYLSAAIVVFLLGVIRSINQNIPADNSISRFSYYVSKENCLVKGRVISNPQSNGAKQSFLFNTQAVQIRNKALRCQGNILVNAYSKSKLDYGDELILQGRLYRAFGRNGYAQYLNKQGIKLLMSVSAASGITKLHKNSGFILKRASFFIADKIRQQLYQYLSPITAGITDAMLLGNKKNIPFIVYRSMMKTGTVHILVVSGFNVGIVAILADMILKILRLKRKARVILIIAVLLIYCFATGASNPVVRATVMAATFLTAVLIKREGDIYNSLGLAAIFILLINPQQLFDVGFQLSFASVLAIVFLYPWMKERLGLDKIRLRPVRMIAEGSLVSLAAWLGASGLIFYYFRSISLIAMLANIFIVPIASFITLNGFALAAFGSLSPYLARLFAPASELAVAILLNLNSLFLKIPGAYVVFR